MDDLELTGSTKRKPGKTYLLIRQRDQKRVGELWINGDKDWRWLDAKGKRLPSTVLEDIVWIVLRTCDEQICRLQIPLMEVLGLGKGEE